MTTTDTVAALMLPPDGRPVWRDTGIIRLVSETSRAVALRCIIERMTVGS